VRRKQRPPQQKLEVVADGGEDRMGRIALGAGQVVADHAVLVLEMAGVRRLTWRLMASVTRRFWVMHTQVASAPTGPSNLLESLQRRLFKPLLKPSI
jgi:hypothetical protein